MHGEERAPSPSEGTGPHLWLDPSGRVGVSPDVVSEADDRFEAVCAELGILLARRVEPVSARVLPFGTEQLAMVELREETIGSAQLHTATARGSSPAAAVAGAAINAVTGGRNVLSAALPGAVAEGKVRSAVVFADGEAPVRWGVAEDEGRLAALYAVVPHLGSFTASTGEDTFRVLRLPGIGVALVSEGETAATWVEGWFAALLHATRFALRVGAPSTAVVAPPAGPPVAAEDGPANRMLRELEDQCRRILTAAQDQAREIREAAERDSTTAPSATVAEATSARPSEDLERAQLALREATDALAREQVRADAAMAAMAMERDRADRAQASSTRAADIERERRSYVDERADEHHRSHMLSVARSTADAILRDAERSRSTILEEARHQSEQLLREASRTRVELLDEARRESDRVLRDAERTRATILESSRREADELLRDAERTRRDAASARRLELDAAHEEAEEIVRHATRAARAEAQAGAAPPRSAAPEPTFIGGDDLAGVAASSPPQDPGALAVSMLGAIADSLRTLSSLLPGAGHQLDAPRGASAPPPTPPPGGKVRPEDLPSLFYGA